MLVVLQFRDILFLFNFGKDGWKKGRVENRYGGMFVPFYSIFIPFAFRLRESGINIGFWKGVTSV